MFFDRAGRRPNTGLAARGGAAPWDGKVSRKPVTRRRPQRRDAPPAGLGPAQSLTGRELAFALFTAASMNFMCFTPSWMLA